MFGKLLSYVTSGITSLIAKYAFRASVAVPFLFALGFGLAGLVVVLIDAFGYRDAYFLLAGGFVALGAIAALAVWLKERNEEVDENSTDTTASAAAVATTAVETAKHIPSAIAGGTSDASASFRDLATLVSRNWPLALAAGLAIIILGGSRSGKPYDSHRRSRL